MKKSRWLSAAFLLCVLTAGCSRTAETSATAAPAAETERVIYIDSETEAPKEAGGAIQERTQKDGMLPSYLTGEWIPAEIADRRPIAVMISNDQAALPHYGMSRAGVIYEAPVEGGMNRFMAFFEDYDDLERIGSVRSCRTYYTYFAREFEAVCVHYGQSTFALPYLEQMDHLDGIAGAGASAFFRSSDRRSPHNAYASGAGIRAAIEKSGYADAYPASYEGHYRFAAKESPVLLEDGIEADYIRPGYQIGDPWFTYNEEDGLYYRFQYGGPHETDEGQLTAKNILFQYCVWDYYSPSEYLDINVHTSYGGYYFTNGRGIPIRWEKDGTYGVTKYYDSDGQEIVLNPGTTWVCILQADRLDKAEIYGKQTE